MEKGMDYVSDKELVSFVVGGKNSDKAAEAILNKGLPDVAKMDYQSLVDSGLSRAQACRLMAIIEIGRRRQHREALNKKRITASKDAFEMMQPVLADLQHEEFWAMYLNRNNKVLEFKRISQGGVSGTVVDVKLIAKRAIELLASSVILVHNHPSGNENPSEADNLITSKFKTGLSLLDVQVLDHIIIADNTFYSYTDQNKL